MHLENSGQYLMQGHEPKLITKREGLTRRSPRNIFIKGKNDIANQTHRQYFPDNSSRKLGNIASLNKSSKSFNKNSPYQRLGTDISRGMTVNSSRKTLKTYQSDLERQISRLNTQISEKDWELKGKNAAKAEDKIKQNQIVELYRVINFYEGKLKGMEMELKIYEEKLSRIGRECDQTSKHKTSISELVSLYESLRHDNQNLFGEIEEKNYEIGNLTNKLKKMEYKYYSLTQHKSGEKKKPRRLETKKDSFEISKKKFFSTCIVKERMDQYGNVHSKINLIESNLQFLKKQNEKLQNELIEKDLQIQELEDELSTIRKEKNDKKGMEEKKMNRNGRAIKGQQQLLRGERKRTIDKGSYDRYDPLSQVVNISKATFKKPQSKISDQDYSFGITLKPQIFRKLKYNLIPQEISYDQLIQTLSNEGFEKKRLSDLPYDLDNSQAQWISQYLTILWQRVRERESEENVVHKVRDELKKRMPYYENATFRKENSFKIQITNEFMNRENEFVSMLKKQVHPEKMNFDDGMRYFKNWGLSSRQLDYLGKVLYEETDQCEYIDLLALQKIFLEGK